MPAGSSDIEHEAKVLDIDIEFIVTKIMASGGKYSRNYMQQRYVFDTVPSQPGKWIRLRTDGTVTTLTYKHIESSDISGTHELEIIVNDFDTAKTILEGAGLRAKGYQENHRFDFTCDGTIISLDIWPNLKPYIEIEAGSAAAVIAVASKLGYSQNQLTTKNTLEIYSDNGINLDEIPNLTLSDDEKRTVKVLLDMSKRQSNQ